MNSRKLEIFDFVIRYGVLVNNLVMKVNRLIYYFNNY